MVHPYGACEVPRSRSAGRLVPGPHPPNRRVQGYGGIARLGQLPHERAGSPRLWTPPDGADHFAPQLPDGGGVAGKRPQASGELGTIQDPSLLVEGHNSQASDQPSFFAAEPGGLEVPQMLQLLAGLLDQKLGGDDRESLQMGVSDQPRRLPAWRQIGLQRKLLVESLEDELVVFEPLAVALGRYELVSAWAALARMLTVVEGWRAGNSHTGEPARDSDGHLANDPPIRWLPGSVSV